MPRGARSTAYLIRYALAYAGGVTAYLPLLTLLLPLKVQDVAAGHRLEILTAATLAGAVAASLSNIAFGVFSDRHLDRHGTRRRWILAGLASTAASYWGLHLAHDPTLIVLAVVVFQVALNMLLAPLIATMADTVPDADKGLAGGALTLAAPFASLTGSAIVGAGWLESGRLAAVMVVAAALMMPLLLGGPGRSVLVETPFPPDVRRARRLDFGLLWLSRLMLQIAGNVLFTYLLFFFESLDPALDPVRMASRVGWISGLALLLALPVALGCGRASDRLGRRKPFVAAAAVAAALGLCAMALAQDVAGAVAGFTLYSCAGATCLALHATFAMQVLPSAQHRGRDLGFLNLANTLPALIGPALTWALATNGRFDQLLLALAGLALIGGLLILPVRSQA